MKTVLSLMLAMVMLAGCSAGAVGTARPDADDDSYAALIEYHSLQIRSRLKIADVRQRRVGDLLQVSVDLQNRWVWALDFQYQFHFYDKDGFEVGGEGRPWTPLVISGSNIATVQATAPNPSAVSFKIVARD
ncbi:MAG TPA: DUF1425 domain-containing protein [Pseudomonadales bacterium]